MKITTSIKKVIASLAAITSLSTCAISTGASAASETSNTNDMMSLYSLASLEDNDPFYYAHYDDYAEFSISPTTHYMAAIVPYGVSLSSVFSVYLYLNNNIVSGDLTNTDRVLISDDYTSQLSLNNITSSSYLPTCRRVTPSFTRTGNTLQLTPLFSYRLDDVQNNTLVDTEYEVHCLTSAYSNNPSSILYTNKGDSLEKVVYSLGDVDRDGDVDNDDVAAIQKYRLFLTQPESNRGYIEGIYDEIAFKLAADFNQDGTINLGDAVAVLMYLAS